MMIWIEIHFPTYVSAITVKYSQLAENLREALMNSPAFIKQHPVLTYYALTFATSITRSSANRAFAGGDRQTQSRDKRRKEPNRGPKERRKLWFPGIS